MTITYIKKDNMAKVSGRLTYDTVPSIYPKIKSSMLNDGLAYIDFQGVTYSDSSGVALLIAWLREANNCKKPLEFCNIPPQMMAIAKVCGVHELLPLAVRN